MGVSLGGLAIGSIAIGGCAVGVFALGGGAFGLFPFGANAGDPREFFPGRGAMPQI